MFISKPSTFSLPRSLWIPVLALVLLALAGCDNMQDQPKFEPYEENPFFPDRRSARPIPAGTVPQGETGREEIGFAGRDENGELLDAFPFEVGLEVLERGRQQYDIYCSPCHGVDGAGQGMIVQRGFPPPPSLHEDRLLQAPAGHFYEVITNGFGQMYAYNTRIDPADRWAVVAYIRALQLSQNASREDVPADEIGTME